MTKATNPWMKFYPSDWRSDPAVRVCSLAARGLWVEMLCIMHEATPRGYLTIKGHAVTDAQLAALSGATIDEITNLIGELETMGVFSRDGKGCIYSRRILRDEKKSKIAQKNGKKGGNPKFSSTGVSNGKQKDISASVNPQDKGRDKGQPNTQKPEARSQIPEDRDNDKSSSLSGDDEKWIENEGRDYLISTGSSDSQARRIVNDWLMAFPADQVRVAIGQAQIAAAASPPAYVAKVLRNGPRSNLQTFPHQRNQSKRELEDQQRAKYEAQLASLEVGANNG
ncbi:hypothetical protein [Thalassospira marina]|uniref:Phage replisome organiser N-terminal domain-containing protein n=1 Tax=Thalassospira marina TaxID=2048283 RepID=A0A2N3KY36_9PROT|nr:hypothetical protein [Thalassospira marina]PKR55423.1 hypothetical protein COO20_04430 [Thalassospira marina]